MTNCLQRPVITTTLNGSSTLIDFPPSVLILGNQPGYSVSLPDATTLLQGSAWYDIWNLSTQPVSIKDNGGNVLLTLMNGSRVEISLSSASTTNGVWTFASTLSGTSGSTLSDLLYTVVKPTAVLKSAMGAVANDLTFTCMAVFQGKLYIGTSNTTAATDSTAAKVLTFDGTTWSVITKATMGMVAADTYISSMAVFQGKLYLGTYNTTAATDSTGAKLVSFDGTTWSVITKAIMGGVTTDQRLSSMVVYGGSLYIGTYNVTAATDSTAAKLLVYYNFGSSWSTINKSVMSAVAADQDFPSMAVYNNILYIGTTNATAAIDTTGSKVISYNGTTWAAVTKTTMGGVTTDTSFPVMAVYNGKLYIGTANATAATDTTGSKLLVWNGTAWAVITKATMGGATTDTNLESMCVYNGKLYIGTKNATAAIDATAAKILQFDQMAWAVIVKSTLGGITTDTDIFSMAIFQGQLWLGTNNATVATDATAARTMHLAYPIAENFNTYCSRGF